MQKASAKIVVREAELAFGHQEIPTLSDGQMRMETGIGRRVKGKQFLQMLFYRQKKCAGASHDSMNENEKGYSNKSANENGKDFVPASTFNGMRGAQIGNASRSAQVLYQAEEKFYQEDDQDEMRSENRLYLSEEKPDQVLAEFTRCSRRCEQKQHSNNMNGANAADEPCQEERVLEMDETTRANKDIKAEELYRAEREQV